MYIGGASPKDVQNNNVTYFNSFGVEHIPKEITTFIGHPSTSASHNKNIKINIFRIQAYDSIMCGYFCIGFIDFMLARKTKFTNFFSPNNFQKNDDIILNYFITNVKKMAECNSIEHNFHEAHNIYPNLNDQQQFRLNNINEIKDYFVAEIKERELMSKRLSKYIASFDYFDNSLIVLSVTAGSISVVSFATVIGAPVGMVSASLSLAFSISTGIVKNC